MNVRREEPRGFARSLAVALFGLALVLDEHFLGAVVFGVRGDSNLLGGNWLLFRLHTNDRQPKGHPGRKGTIR